MCNDIGRNNAQPVVLGGLPPNLPNKVTFSLELVSPLQVTHLPPGIDTSLKGPPAFSVSSKTLRQM